MCCVATFNAHGPKIAISTDHAKLIYNPGMLPAMTELLIYNPKTKGKGRLCVSLQLRIWGTGPKPRGSVNRFAVL